MGGAFRHVARAIGLRCAVFALPFCASAAFAECPPVITAPHCAQYLTQLADNTCLSAGSTFMQNGNVWTDITNRNTALKSSKANSVSFFLVVDANLTKQKNLTNGLVFVGIIRSFKSPQSTQVKLTHNEGDDKQLEDLEIYSNAMRGHPPDQILNSWGKTSSEYLFKVSSIPLSERARLDFGPPDVSQPALHARLYTFVSGNSLECIPFTAGLDPTLNYIEGKALDMLGETQQSNSFVVTITPAN